MFTWQPAPLKYLNLWAHALFAGLAGEDIEIIVIVNRKRRTSAPSSSG